MKVICFNFDKLCYVGRHSMYYYPEKTKPNTRLLAVVICYTDIPSSSFRSDDFNLTNGNYWNKNKYEIIGSGNLLHRYPIVKLSKWWLQLNQWELLEQKQIRDYWQLLATALTLSVSVSNNVFSFMHKLERTIRDAIRIAQQWVILK